MTPRVSRTWKIVGLLHWALLLLILILLALLVGLSLYLGDDIGTIVSELSTIESETVHSGIEIFSNLFISIAFIFTGIGGWKVFKGQMIGRLILIILFILGIPFNIFLSHIDPLYYSDWSIWGDVAIYLFYGILLALLYIKPPLKL